jgi:hypothetical protein
MGNAPKGTTMPDSLSDKLTRGDYNHTYTPVPKGATEDERQAIHQENNRKEGEMTEKFRADLEAEEGTARLPEALRDKVWSLAWEAGHYAGLSEVYCVYGKYADLAELAFEAGIKSTR